MPSSWPSGELGAGLLYGADEDVLDAEIEDVLQGFIAFVRLCERVETRTGRPVTIIASY